MLYAGRSHYTHISSSWCLTRLRATNFNDQALEAVVAEAECRDKIQALRQEQEYNVEMLAALETEWSAVEKIHTTAEARLQALEGKLAEAQDEVRNLERQLGPA